MQGTGAGLSCGGDVLGTVVGVGVEHVCGERCGGSIIDE